MTPASEAPTPPVDEVLAGLARMGVVATRMQALAGDASTRQFYRVTVAGGGTVVAAWYPSGSDGRAEEDAAAQAWARRRGLPVPELVAAAGRLVVSGDLGAEDLESSLRRRRPGVLAALRECLAAFQGVDWRDAPNPPFDASFFRRELTGFESHFLSEGAGQESGLGGFLDELAGSIATHPYRLAHRDFHLNNLFLNQGRVIAVDFQDLRGGPDSYDVASLLYERAAPELITDPLAWADSAAAACSWSDGWRGRLLECRAQRGLKVLGTFARLARERGGGSYAGWLHDVRRQTATALAGLEAPRAIVRLLEHPHPCERL